MGNFITDDIETVWGFLEDAMHLGRNRSLAEDVRVLASVAVQKQKAAGRPAATLSESLENTKRLLQKAVEPPAEAVKARTFQVEWGRRTEAAGAQPAEGAEAAEAVEVAPREAVASGSVQPCIGESEIQPSSAESVTGEKPIARETPSNLPAEVAVQEKALSAETIAAAIELFDWLDRVRENDKIAPERANLIATQKCGSLLAALGVERIEDHGAFNEDCQQIVDSVATDSEEKNMQVYETVRCGYRMKGQMIRPQLVMVYRLGSRKATSLQT